MEQYSPGLLPSHLQFGREKDKANWFEQQQELFMMQQMQEEADRQAMLRAKLASEAQMGLEKYKTEIAPAKLAQLAEEKDNKQYQAQIAKIMKDRGISAEEAQAVHSFLYKETPQAQTPKGMQGITPEQEAKERQEYIKMIMGQSRGVDEEGNALPGASFKDAYEQVEFMLRARKERDASGMPGAGKNQNRATKTINADGTTSFNFSNIPQNNTLGGKAGGTTNQGTTRGSGSIASKSLEELKKKYSGGGMPAYDPGFSQSGQNNALNTFNQVGNALSQRLEPARDVWSSFMENIGKPIGESITRSVKRRQDNPLFNSWR